MDKRQERAERVERFFSVPVIVAAVLSLPVIVLEETAVSDTLKDVAAVLNWAIWLVFLAELVAMLWVVPDRWRWLARNPLDVMIVVLTPPVLPAGLQFLRILRLIRLLKLVQVSRQVFSLQGLRFAAILALLTIIGGGWAFTEVEKDQNLDLWDGVWWAVSTMTTVGSDIYPQTTGGRIIAMALMVVGIGFVAFLTGYLAERFLAPEIEEEISEVRQEIEDEEGIAGADEARLLNEVRAMGQRMGALEAEIERLMRRPQRGG
jgi:voltage-gated potassium channel